MTKSVYYFLTLFICLFLGMQQGWAANATSATIDFGTVGYLSGSTEGSSQIELRSDGSTNPSGAGPLKDPAGGTAGSTTVSASGLEWLAILFGAYTQIKTDRSNTPVTGGTNACGYISVSDFRTTGNATTANGEARQGSYNFPLGATLQVTSFTGTDPAGCEISVTTNNHVGCKISSNNNYDNVSVTAKVRVVPSISVSHDIGAVLDFGNICKTDHVQTITVFPDGTSSAPGAACSVDGVSADSFTVTGLSGASYSVSFPESSTTLTNGVSTLTLNNLTSSCSPQCSLSSTRHTFTVGGTLTVPTDATVGTYEGSYTVSVVYE